MLLTRMLVLFARLPLAQRMSRHDPRARAHPSPPPVPAAYPPALGQFIKPAKMKYAAATKLINALGTVLGAFIS